MVVRQVVRAVAAVASVAQWEGLLDPIVIRRIACEGIVAKKLVPYLRALPTTEEGQTECARVLQALRDRMPAGAAWDMAPLAPVAEERGLADAAALFRPQVFSLMAAGLAWVDGGVLGCVRMTQMLCAEGRCASQHCANAMKRL